MKREKICCIYKIISPSGMIYIGQTINWYKRRTAYLNFQCKKQSKIYTSFELHGIDAHTFEIVQECLPHELNDLEVLYINKHNSFDTPNGLNLTSGGNSNNKVSVETRSRQAKSAIGRKHKPESLIKMSIASSKRKYPGRKYSEEHRKARSIFSTGRKQSPEAIEKTRLANIGKKLSEETKRKLSLHFKGKKRPREIVEKKCKIILNHETGIFYIGAKEVAEQMGVSELSASRRLNGYLINKTPFVYV